ncbi:MAG: hypothetical protein AABZ06_13120 [Bdellovibrionota bacterium]
MRTALICLVMSCLAAFCSYTLWGLSELKTLPKDVSRVDPAEFRRVAMEWIEKNKTDIVNGAPVVPAVPAEEGDNYLLAHSWRFVPLFKMKKGRVYRLRISSSDMLYGLSFYKDGLNFKIIPGYEQIITISPREAGGMPIFCNEYCGLGHHLMTGRIVVED